MRRLAWVSSITLSGKVHRCLHRCPTAPVSGRRLPTFLQGREEYRSPLSDSPTCPTLAHFPRKKWGVVRCCRTECRTELSNPGRPAEVLVSDCRASDRVPEVGRTPPNGPGRLWQGNPGQSRPLSSLDTFGRWSVADRGPSSCRRECG